MPLVQRNGVWYADLRGKGGSFLSCKTRDRTAAEIVHNEMERAVLTSGTVGRSKPTGATLGQAFDRAMRLHYHGMSSTRTVGFHRKALAASIPESTLLSAIGVDDFERFVLAQRDKGNSDTTINRVMQTTGRVLKLAVGWRMLDDLPELPKFKEHKGRTRVVEYDEEQRIIAEFERMGHHEMALIAVFLLDTGLRLGEYMKRDRQAFHEGRREAEVWKTKVGDGRTLPLTPRAAAAFKALRAVPELTKDQIEGRWQTMRRNIGLECDKEFVIHALRHTCCTRLWRSGKMTAAQIMVWMGHKDIKTTMRYTHLLGSDLVAGSVALESMHSGEQASHGSAPSVT